MLEDRSFFGKREPICFTALQSSENDRDRVGSAELTEEIMAEIEVSGLASGLVQMGKPEQESHCSSAVIMGHEDDVLLAFAKSLDYEVADSLSRLQSTGFIGRCPVIFQQTLEAGEITP